MLKTFLKRPYRAGNDSGGHDPLRRVFVFCWLPLSGWAKTREETDLSMFGPISTSGSNSEKASRVNKETRRAILDIKTSPFFAKGDGVTDDHAAIDFAFQYASKTGVRLLFSPGEYLVKAHGPGAVLFGRSNVWVEFSQGAVLKLSNPDRHPLSCFLEHSKVEDTTYVGLSLEGGGEMGPNGFGANNSHRIRCDNPNITGFRRDPRTGGGRGVTFQFNCRDIQVNKPKISGCTTGLDFHGRHQAPLHNIIINDPAISECEEAISFYDLFDGNKFLDNESDVCVTIKGGFAHNCGKSTVGLASRDGGLDGGAIVSEQGRSFRIQGLSILNDTDYGKIGAVIRGSCSNSHIDVMHKGDCVSFVMFSPALNLAPVKPSAAAVSRRNTISVVSTSVCDYVVYSDNLHGLNMAKENKLSIQCCKPLVSVVNSIASKGEGNYLKLIDCSNSRIIEGDFAELYRKGVEFSGSNN